MASESLKAFLFGMVKESGKGGGAGQLPETPSMGDQEHGGEAGATGDELSHVEDEAGPDEFAAHVEQVRAAWPDGAPMQCQDVPDWSAFCSGWWRDCFVCPYYDGNPNGSPCALWEAAFPGVVRWYTMRNCLSLDRRKKQ